MCNPETGALILNKGNEQVFENAHLRLGCSAAGEGENAMLYGSELMQKLRRVLEGWTS